MNEAGASPPRCSGAAQLTAAVAVVVLNRRYRHCTAVSVSLRTGWWLYGGPAQILGYQSMPDRRLGLIDKLAKDDSFDNHTSPCKQAQQKP